MPSLKPHLPKRRSTSKGRKARYSTRSSARTIDIVAQNLIDEGIDPEIGLIAKITKVLEGKTEILETLDSEERAIFDAQMEIIQRLRDDHPSDVESDGVPGNYKAEAMGRADRYNVRNEVEGMWADKFSGREE